MLPLRRLSDLLRGRLQSDPAELRAYSEAVRPEIERLDDLFAGWRRALELNSDEDEMANAASIQRWEAAGMIDRLRRIQPPTGLTWAHAELQSLAGDTARASQLLSNGYRFHSSRARCEGQDLMLTAEERIRALVRTLAQNGISVAPGAGDAAASDE
jgi:hypothetical protein